MQLYTTVQKFGVSTVYNILFIQFIKSDSKYIVMLHNFFYFKSTFK